MARQTQAEKAAEKDAPETVKLVSPDGEVTREVVVDSKEEVSLRFDGFLPAEQAKLEAPPKPVTGEPTTVGTNGE